MKLGIGTGGAALLMGVSLGCNAVLDIDAGVPRDAPACDDESRAHWRPNDLKADRWNVGESDVTVLDPVTSLRWERGVALGKLTWDEANVYCETSDLGGYDDWRLPSRIELVSIVNYEASSPAIAEDVFTGTVHDDYLWSLPMADVSPKQAWSVHVEDGDVGSAETEKKACPPEEESPEEESPEEDPAHENENCQEQVRNRVRCVRTEKTVSQERCGYELGVTGETVIDNDTRLTWQRELKDDLPQDRAVEFCEDFELAGITSWRLPTVQQLQTIVDHSTSHPAIDREWFPEPESAPPGYWSSTAYAGDVNRDPPVDPSELRAWWVSFRVGYATNQRIGTHGRVRCVYDGP
ncbi:DUF1566 domain-containing protein [Sorangium sp. So ce385]|uniref:Lcl C-terminal domain-containing protein n=1 Tax=Sorangium sp. So ce385 TaxID=3133308 RepID=UPI003F5B307D